MLYDVYYFCYSGRKLQLNEWPLTGTLEDVQCWADNQTAHTPVSEFVYQEAKCFGKHRCEFLKYVGWTPHHPEWKCQVGGKCDRHSTVCLECPNTIEITEP